MNKEDREKMIAFWMKQAIDAQTLIARPDTTPEAERRAHNLFQTNMALIAELRNEEAREREEDRIKELAVFKQAGKARDQANAERDMINDAIYRATDERNARRDEIHTALMRRGAEAEERMAEALEGIREALDTIEELLSLKK